MLQVSNDNFFNPDDEIQESVHRAPIYTNAIFFDDNIETPIGKLLNTTINSPYKIIIAEMNCKQKKKFNNGESNPLSCMGGNEMIADISAIFSFSMNATCTTSSHLIESLLQGDTSNSYKKPSLFISQFFDQDVVLKDREIKHFKNIISMMLKMNRKDYEVALKSIHRYVSAMYRILDDSHAAYSLLVASLEALAQTEKGSYQASWNDYDEAKRNLIDQAIITLHPEEQQLIRDEIIKKEHAKIKENYTSYVISNIEDDFYRIDGRDYRKISKDDLYLALKKSYDLRSSYIHELKKVPKEISGFPTHDMRVLIDGKPFLTFNGLAVVVREVIKNFIIKSKKEERKKEIYDEVIHGIFDIKKTDEYWIANPNKYTKSEIKRYLNIIIDMIEKNRLNPCGNKVIDVHGLMVEIEKKIKGENNKDDKAIMVLTFLLIKKFFHLHEGIKSKINIENSRELFSELNINSLVFIALLREKFIFQPRDAYEFMEKYRANRYEKPSMNISEYVEFNIMIRIMNESFKIKDIQTYTHAMECIADMPNYDKLIGK
ncbi:hypothetical protein FXN80_14835 [Dickeya fangzhongdai]|uniref:hypothetical protein n=1 Tax=Dickeya fangzhongdai TaxID=1778540 RepID=UPI0013720C09|nr:hypothetical protein [Dickeya fangzhongdai]UMB75388.1 hypothetical protein FXN80_14835 [Dickeya fangzhongdai]